LRVDKSLLQIANSPSSTFDPLVDGSISSRHAKYSDGQKASAPTDRAKRLLSRLHEISAHYQKLVAQGVKTLAKPERVAEAE
jgi:hypothetical protein